MDPMGLDGPKGLKGFCGRLCSLYGEIISRRVLFLIYKIICFS